MQHHFTVEIAEEYGINCAILLDNFIYWQKYNEANQTNYHDGRYWTYSTVKAYTLMFPYLSTQSIRTAINKLMDAGLLVSGEYSDNPYDHTKWYSVTEKGMQYYQVDLLPPTNVELLPATNRDVGSNKSHDIQIIKSENNKTNIDKHPYGDFGNVLLTDDELEKLKQRFPTDWEDWIQLLDQGIESKGYKYKSHYAAILSWSRKDKPKGGARIIGKIYT